MRIGIDVDSVLADLTWAVCANRGWDHSLWTEWDVWKKYGLSGHQEFSRVLDEAWMGWSRIPVQELGIVRLMEMLMEKHTVIIISNRNRKTQPYQMLWLQRQCIPYHVYVGNDSVMPKHVFPIDCLLDDNPHEVERFRYTTKRLFLRNQPWNQDVGELPTNVTRVGSLREFMEMVI